MTHFLDFDYYRYIVENERNKIGGYNKSGKMLENVVCSRGIFGKVDGG